MECQEILLLTGQAAIRVARDVNVKLSIVAKLYPIDPMIMVTHGQTCIGNFECQ